MLVPIREDLLTFCSDADLQILEHQFEGKGKGKGGANLKAL